MIRINEYKFKQLLNIPENIHNFTICKQILTGDLTEPDGGTPGKLDNHLIFKNMKRNSFILAAMAAVAAVACGPNVSKTSLTGSFGADTADAPEWVTIKIQDLDIDTGVVVTDGKFSVELPVSKVSSATLTADGVRVNFIPDGTPLTFSVNEDGSAVITSATPAVSLHERFKAYSDAMTSIEKGARAKLEALGDEASDSAREEILEAYNTAVNELNSKTFNENRDNIIGLSVFRTMQYDCTPAQVDSMLNLFDPSLAENPVIQKVRKANDAKKATAEGSMFTDFDINGVKLSDYVGKGKYVLVDFWASWCGPCKREIPNIKKVYDKYAGNDFDVLSVAVWDKPQASVDTAKAYGVNWKEIVDAQNIPTDLYGIQGIPHIILFGPDGAIIKRDLRGEGIEEEVAKYVTAKK